MRAFDLSSQTAAARLERRRHFLLFCFHGAPVRVFFHCGFGVGKGDHFRDRHCVPDCARVQNQWKNQNQRAAKRRVQIFAIERLDFAIQKIYFPFLFTLKSRTGRRRFSLPPVRLLFLSNSSPSERTIKFYQLLSECQAKIAQKSFPSFKRGSFALSHDEEIPGCGEDYQRYDRGGQNRDQPGDNHCQRIAFFHHIGQLEVVPTGAITLARFVLFLLELARALEFALEQDHSSG